MRQMKVGLLFEEKENDVGELEIIFWGGAI